MWDFDSMYGKAQTYFARGAEHEHSDDDEFVIWHLLGFEFLLRMPLAKLHASLLAAPEGDSVLAANGIPAASEAKSVPSHTVVSRLMHIVPSFSKERQQDCMVLLNLRNAELHTAAAAVGNVQNEFWLPKLLRVAELICAYLEIELDDVLEGDVVELGRSLVDLEDKKLAHEVHMKIEAAKQFFSKLTPLEVSSRSPETPAAWFLGPPQQHVDCPACKVKVPIQVERVRTSGQRFVEDGLVRDVIYVATQLTCPVCALELQSTAEIVAAGLSQQITVQEWEDISDRFLQEVMEEEYGND